MKKVKIIPEHGNPALRRWGIAEVVSSSLIHKITSWGDQENFNGRPVLVRFIISDVKKESCKFEQSFSADGGKTWEINWIAIDARVKE